MKLAVFLFFLSLPVAVPATTWGEVEVDDPIFEGKKCSVHEPASYGSYIYSWPSKYDQVFWPITEKNGIWFCEESGFTAFIGDFSEITDSEVEMIKDYLINNPPQDSSIETQLAYLEKLYSFRVINDAFENRLLRVLARWNQELGNLDKANQYRKEALKGIELSLEEKLDENRNLEYLYLAANYTRQFGDEKKSDHYLSQLRSLIEQVESENAKGFAEYLKELSLDTVYIKAAGALDPEVPESLAQ